MRAENFLFSVGGCALERKGKNRRQTDYRLVLCPIPRRVSGNHDLGFAYEFPKSLVIMSTIRTSGMRLVNQTKRRDIGNAMIGIRNPSFRLLALLPVAAAALMWSAPRASAELVACADKNQAIEIALARWENKRFISRGWYEVPGKTCRVLIGRQLPRRGKYYFFAREKHGKRVWPNQAEKFRPICVSPSREFAHREYSSLGPKCPEGFEQRRFGVRLPINGRIQLRF